MIDLTPLDVRKKRGDFRRILRGYDPQEVDGFLDLVSERLEELVRQNLSLSDKAERLEAQLAALEGREKAVQEALVSAQKLREEVGDQSRKDAEVLQEQANRNVELMKAQAETEIARRLSEADALVRERQRALEELERSRLKFLKSFRGLLERELDAVEVEEARRPLEDTPLELEFRGWMPGGRQKGPGEEEVPVTEEPEPLEVVAVESLRPDDDGKVAEEEEAEESGPGGFDTQILSKSTFPGGGESEGEGEEGEAGADGTQTEESRAEDADGDDSPDDSTEEPKWLFSLLKKEEREGKG